jgi:hypothetical protein
MILAIMSKLVSGPMIDGPAPRLFHVRDKCGSTGTADPHRTSLLRECGCGAVLHRG